MSRAGPLLYRHRFSSMGCPAAIAIYAASDSAAGRACERAQAEVERLDRKYSHYRADSALVELMAAAARPGGVEVDRETAALLDFAATQHRESGGRFDITAGRLTALWDRAGALPAATDIETALRLTGWSRVGWDGTKLYLPAGMRLDFGGIVKEYAADRAALQLKACGIRAGWVELGGDLHVLGPHPDGSGWRIGIRDPRGPGAFSSITLARGGLATSGDYERCSLIDGRRYGHIIDPTSGWPVQGLASVSVVAPSCLLAGAVSTLAMLLPGDPALDFLRASGLRWLAHDGFFYFAGGDGMLPCPNHAPGADITREFRHAEPVPHCSEPPQRSPVRRAAGGLLLR